MVNFQRLRSVKTTLLDTLARRAWSKGLRFNKVIAGMVAISPIERFTMSMRMHTCSRFNRTGNRGATRLIGCHNRKVATFDICITDGPYLESSVIDHNFPFRTEAHS